jgi:hypothetical protein
LIRFLASGVTVSHSGDGYWNNEAVHFWLDFHADWGHYICKYWYNVGRRPFLLRFPSGLRTLCEYWNNEAVYFCSDFYADWGYYASTEITKPSIFVKISVRIVSLCQYWNNETVRFC